MKHGKQVTLSNLRDVQIWREFPAVTANCQDNYRALTGTETDRASSAAGRDEGCLWVTILLKENLSLYTTLFSTGSWQDSVCFSSGESSVIVLTTGGDKEETEKAKHKQFPLQHSVSDYPFDKQAPALYTPHTLFSTTRVFGTDPCFHSLLDWSACR